MTFDFDYQPGAIHYGRGRLGALETLCADRDIQRALVVCGRNVGANSALMEPLEAGLGDRHAGTFAETTPDKRLATAVAAAQRAADLDADALVPVGGGSSLDVATVAAAVRGRSLSAVRAAVDETGGIAAPDEPTPLIAVPTTLAGADLSSIAGITVELGDRTVATGVGGIDPTAIVYDPAAVETTPVGPLTGSAMNGFDKAVESLYARTGTPVTDATARAALERLVPGLQNLLTPDGYDERAMERVVTGIVLAQYGVSRSDGTTLNLLHALGHGLRDAFGVQQGLAHAVLAPHGVRALAEAGVKLDRLVAAFDAADPTGVTAAVEGVRDALNLPGRLRELDGVDRDGIDEAAAVAATDSLTAALPEGFELSEAAARQIITAAW